MVRSPVDQGPTKLCRWLYENGLHGPTDEERKVVARRIAHSAMCQFRADSYRTRFTSSTLKPAGIPRNTSPNPHAKAPEGFAAMPDGP